VTMAKPSRLSLGSPSRLAPDSSLILGERLGAEPTDRLRHACSLEQLYVTVARAGSSQAANEKIGGARVSELEPDGALTQADRTLCAALVGKTEPRKRKRNCT
jgi:hypothetical protein